MPKRIIPNICRECVGFKKLCWFVLGKKKVALYKKILNFLEELSKADGTSLSADDCFQLYNELEETQSELSAKFRNLSCVTRLTGESGQFRDIKPNLGDLAPRPKRARGTSLLLNENQISKRESLRLMDGPEIQLVLAEDYRTIDLEGGEKIKQKCFLVKFNGDGKIAWV